MCSINSNTIAFFHEKAFTKQIISSTFAEANFTTGLESKKKAFQIIIVYSQLNPISKLMMAKRATGDT
ncbi:hypothetical protein Y032_0288g1469 [Ancylostoma ceylanicum]|uniref:Uncharacterized protein n=1 Tax=Ancylostoma ceylanicum TaxID=53326 RepID=A0A016S5G7_9BILA|nr:hypothetical protein Y032_0288g1469 [Ancylostoma ceylanicum]